jgi:ATP-dependent DNA helicase UvrD/PcrA
LLDHLLNRSVADKEHNHTKKKENSRKKLEAEICNISPIEILNEDQYLSATSVSENNLVIASAGTGKTSTIIGRVYYLITEKKYNPEDIILLTFTSKAGSEMLERLLNYFDKNTVDKIFAGTFHSYGKMLFEKRFGTKYKLIQDDSIDRIFKNLYWDNIEKYSLDSDECIAPSTVSSHYALFRNKSSVNNKDGFYNYLVEKEMDEKQADFYADVGVLYKEEKKKYHLIDFTDYLEYLRHIFAESKSNFKEIIVDEYQDTNKLQNDILFNVTQNSKVSLFCVGDFDQSIYSFNGSDITVMSNFPIKYKGAEVLFLKKNYRSSRLILNIAEKLIGNNLRIFDKELVPMIEKEFSKPKSHIFRDSNEEHEFIINEIMNSDYDLNDIAILFRGNKSGDYIELELLENDIAVDRQDKSNYLQSKEAQLFLSFMKLKSKPNVLDLYSAFYGLVSDSSAKMVYHQMMDEGRGGFYRGLSSHSLQNSLVKIQASSGLMSAFIDVARRVNTVHSPIEVYNIIKGSDYFNSFVQNSQKKQYPNISSKSLSALKRIIEYNNTFSKILIKETLAKSGDEKYGVKLMTVHASKGLEFKKVFVIHLTDKRFPNQKLMTSGGSIEEERRLMYVAITRAKEVLHFTSSKRYGKSDEKPSRFIEECGLHLNIH